MERFFMHGHDAWLRKSVSDLNSAKKLLKDDDETLDTAIYHTQQCAEKALKAYLVYRKHNFPKTHDLERILEACNKLDASFYSLLDETLALTPYATYSRYPDDRFIVDRKGVENAIVMATKILHYVKVKISESSDPNMKIF